MKANRVTGLIAVKDGKIVLEKYALGRKPDGSLDVVLGRQVRHLDLIGAAIKDGYIKSIYDSGHRLPARAEGHGL